MNPRDPFIARHYPETRFGGYADVDGTVVFYNRVHALLRSTDVVLDAGCGRGSHADDDCAWRRELHGLRGRAARIIGLDSDPQAALNPTIDEFIHATSTPWPLGDASVDLVVCDFVIEHLENPDAFLHEVRRVLRPGGHFCARTTNRHSYVSLLARCLPRHWHPRALATAQPARRSVDVFRAHYRCNTPRALRHVLGSLGFEAVVYGYEAAPGYLAFSGLAYRLGVWFQRFAPGRFKPTLFVFARVRQA
jgi:ubiquinone/menaquinone biosynthesis C-methylase UbiE